MDKQSSYQALHGASPQQAVSRFFLRYFAFKGSASRSEYWWIFFLLTIGSFFVSMLDNHLGDFHGVSLEEVIAAIVFLPFLALLSRRLQDAGFSGILVVLFFIPIVGTIPLMIMTLLPSSDDKRHLFFQQKVSPSSQKEARST